MFKTGILIFFMLFGGMALGKTRAKPPEVVYDKQGFNRCIKPKECFGRQILVKNPNKRKTIRVKVSCGPEYILLDTEINIPPKQEVLFDLGTDSPKGLNKGDCNIVSWLVR